MEENMEFYENQSSGNGQEDKKGNLAKILGIVGAVLNFIGWCCCIGYAGVPVSIVAIVLAMMSKSENGGEFTKDAKLGLILGIVGLAILALGFIIGLVLGVAIEGMNMNI